MWPKCAGTHAYCATSLFTPKRELANFVAQRAFVLRDHRRYREAVETFAVAAGLTPEYANYPRSVMFTLGEWKKHLQSQYPPRFPRQVEVNLRPGQARWPWMPWEVEREIAALHTTEWCLNNPDYVKWWWEPLRQNRQPLRDVPTRIGVDYDLLVRNN